MTNVTVVRGRLGSSGLVLIISHTLDSSHFKIQKEHVHTVAAAKSSSDPCWPKKKGKKGNVWVCEKGQRARNVRAQFGVDSPLLKLD